MSTRRQTTSSRRSILKWEMWGIPVIFLAGAVVHFVYGWSGELAFVGVFAPVNESVWEHFKLGFWPTCLYAAIEWIYLRNHAKNFLTAKTVALYVIPLTVGLIFYGYTAVLDEEILAVDILSYLVAVGIAQAVSCKILFTSKVPQYVTVISFVFALILATSLAVFSFCPPHLPIFIDSRGFYGIP